MNVADRGHLSQCCSDAGPVVKRCIHIASHCLSLPVSFVCGSGSNFKLAVQLHALYNDVHSLGLGLRAKLSILEVTVDKLDLPTRSNKLFPFYVNIFQELKVLNKFDLLR